MNRSISLLLFVGGVVFLIYGVSAADSISSSFSRFFTGAPTDKTMWFLIGGSLATVVGAVGMLRDAKSN